MSAPASPSPGIRIDRFRVAEGTLVRLVGAIDERFPTDVFAAAQGVLAVDMAGVLRITSFGIRAWRQALGGAPSSHVYFTSVPPCGMAQFGMVTGFGGARGQILSFLAPYRCGACGAEKQRLVDRRSDASGALEHPPEIACDCGALMEFDDLPELYREALAGTASLNVVPALFAVLAAADSASRPLKITKSVEESATLLWLSGALDGRAQLRHAADGLEGEVVLVGDQVTACDGAGIERLARVVAQAIGGGCRVWLARPAPALEEALAAAPDALGGAIVVPRAYEERVLPPGVPPLLDRRPAPGGTNTGRAFLDRYALIRPLGAGGMAEIFLARQLGPAGFDRRVAIKRILPHLAREDSFVQMLLAEARNASRLSHPNIVQIHELLEADGQYCIVMEYVEGRDLAALLRAARRAGTPMPVECALRVGAGVCAALQAAHGARDDAGRPLSIIHRDVSPHNVLIGNDGSVKLADFGIARAADRLEHTRPGVLKGKSSYLAPELLSNKEPAPQADHRVDLFAAGITLFECLAGYHPFRGATDYRTYQAIVEQALPAVSATRYDVTRDVDAVLARATAKDPAQRYASADAMLSDLEELIADLGRPAGAPALAAWVASLADFEATAEAEVPETSVTKTTPNKPQ